MSLLPEAQLPPVLPELPPAQGQQQASIAEATPVSKAAPIAAVPRPRRPEQQPPSSPASPRDQAPSKTRVCFTPRDDRRLFRYVVECAQEGLKISGNKIYMDFEKKVRCAFSVATSFSH